MCVLFFLPRMIPLSSFFLRCTTHKWLPVWSNWRDNIDSFANKWLDAPLLWPPVNTIGEMPEEATKWRPDQLLLLNGKKNTPSIFFEDSSVSGWRKVLNLFSNFGCNHMAIHIAILLPCQSSTAFELCWCFKPCHKSRQSTSPATHGANSLPLSINTRATSLVLLPSNCSERWPPHQEALSPVYWPPNFCSHAKPMEKKLLFQPPRYPFQ